MSHPRYENYKASGIDWLDQIPHSWLMCKVKHISPFFTGWTPPTGRDDFYAGDNLWANISDLGPRTLFQTSKHISDSAIEAAQIQKTPKGSLLFSFKLSIGQVSFAGVDLYTNEAIASFTPNEKLDLGYAYYAYPIFLVKNASTNIYGAKLLNQELIRSADVALPSITEQKYIAEFLDYEIGNIDELIAQQERLIELLKEKRQASIAEAVTKGIASNVKLKNSGVEWLGLVPEHWQVLPLKRFFQLVVDQAPVDNDFELLSLYTDIGVKPRRELEARGNRASTTDGYFKVAKGDIVVNKLLAWMGALGVSEYDGVTSPAYDILRAKCPLSSHYYDHLFRCGVLNTEFRKYSRGIMDMRLRLYFEEFGQFQMPFPPYEEQLEIVEKLKHTLEQFASLSNEATKAIELLQERRSALITAVVTGQIDVRNSVHITEAV
jgi:type I restriction enzyme S subunit